VSEAIFGLIGVALGGLITWGIQFFFEQRRNEDAVRQAKRLVAEELQTIWLNLKNLADAGTAPTYPYGVDLDLLPTVAWEANKTTLARHLSDDDWNELPTLMHAAFRLQQLYVRGEHGRPLTRDEIERNRELAATASELYSRLRDGRQIDD
jgi:hypothetical protein